MTKSRYTYEYFADVLINKADLHSFEELEEFEAVHTYRRLSELALCKEKFGNFDIKHLKDIHRYIFQDVYFDEVEMEQAGDKHKGKLPLRGEFRSENIAKGNFQFANALYIEHNLRYLLEVELKNDNFLKGLPFEQFIKKVAYYFAELNVLHCHREGNGRTTREFIRQLAFFNDYIIDWGLLDKRKDEFLDAMIFSVSDTSKLERILTDITHRI